jgi:2-polyprenyl-3-methyl-5-hydroxy-6-metoxy-1,4-benzoquinol methylase
MKASVSCRHCGLSLEDDFVDLGSTPLANSYLTEADARSMEPFYPLHAYVCRSCFLVQLVHDVTPEQIFREYAYFSSYSDTWLAHARRYVDAMTRQCDLNHRSHVVEIAGNDGYLLQYFREKTIPVLNIEPARNVAKASQEKGIPTVTEFFGAALAEKLADENKRADLLLGNNVLAHVPDINDFVQGLKILLKPHGVVTMEFPHLSCLMRFNQFDTIYHEHYSYLSLSTVIRIFEAHGLTIFDVEELGTHGGSLRIYAAHDDDHTKLSTRRMQALRERELAEGVNMAATYSAFHDRVKQTKRRILKLLIEIKEAGKSIAGYGAPAKGNTLLNYCGIGTDFIDYTVDRSPHKQGLLLPGSHIPIFHPDKIKQTKPDYVLILPWNIKDEIMEQMSYIREWGGKFLVAIPEPVICEDA